MYYTRPYHVVFFKCDFPLGCSRTLCYSYNFVRQRG